jgi:hypothetical protein
VRWNYIKYLFFKKSTTCTNTTDFIAAYGYIRFKFFFGVLTAVDYLCLLGNWHFDIVYSFQKIVFILLKKQSLTSVWFCNKINIISCTEQTDQK